jgi:hypothetical protein
MQSVNISYWDSIKFPYFANTAKRQDRGWKQAQIEVEDRVSLWLTLISTSNLVEVRTLLVTMKSMLQGLEMCWNVWVCAHFIKIKEACVESSLNFACPLHWPDVTFNSWFRQLFKTKLKCYFTKMKRLQTIWGMVGHTIPFQESFES